MELRHVAAALVLVGLTGTFAWAGERAPPVSSETLAAMGLPAMRPLEDAAGATVRGKFTFAVVFGFARVGGNVNPYVDAGANHASGFRPAIGPSGGGIGFSFGGARAWAN